jgi:L-amino acid N-acyltransferase YncA
MSTLAPEEHIAKTNTETARGSIDDILIRPATIDDLPAIRDIYNEAVLYTTATYDTEPQTMEAREGWFEDHQKSGLPMFVALDGNTVVAWSSLSNFRGKDGYRFTVENSIYITESYRGRGLGKRLLAGLIDAARQLGLHGIIAGIDAATEASIRLHAAFGFEQVAYLKQVGFKFDRWLDVVFMQLILD